MLDDQRRDVVAYCRRMVTDGLVVGTSGNVSVRHGDLIAVSPSGLPYDQLTPDLVGVHDREGTPVVAPLPPTSELAMHLAIYRDTDARAVVHTHSVAATAASTLVDVLPPVHYLVAMFGGDVRVAGYATYGTPELAASVRTALAGRTGCLLANHGTVTIGTDLATAYSRAQYLEWLCDVWLRAAAAGNPRLLPADEIERVAGKLSGYGVNRDPDAAGLNGPGATPAAR